MLKKKKLIEVALPLPEINDASAYDKMPGIGPHPKGIHHWWARLPLPTARAILFASVVDDPVSDPEKWPTEDAQNLERERLFNIIRKMMGKKLHDQPEVYVEARAEMLKYTEGRLPDVFDPFSGGGSIPLEANRLGFRAHAADLNPVAVLLNKCNLELAPRWLGVPPVNSKDRTKFGGDVSWRGTAGLASDLRYYAKVIRDQAQALIGHLYPNVRLSKKYGGREAQVVAWIWARTVVSPHPPANRKHVPLVSTYWLSSKKGAEAWLKPVVDKAKGTYAFEIHDGAPPNKSEATSGTKRGRGSNFQCLLTEEPISEDHIRSEGQGQRFDYRLLATVASIGRGRIYVPATEEQQEIARIDMPSVESGDMPNNARWFSPPLVGLRTYTSVFTPRQLTSMLTLSDLVKGVQSTIRDDARASGMGGEEAEAYSRTIVTFLALAVDRCSDFNNALCRWSPSNEKVMNLFGRQAIPMMWDFAEANILGDSVGAWSTCSDYVADCVEVLAAGANGLGDARQIDAATGANGLSEILISTDPPYYDNIGYAALSDFFYFWLRRTISHLYPDIFSTVLVPKIPELTASPERFGGNKEKASEHFEAGFRRAFSALRDKMDPRFPLTVYYAFKQDDEESGSAEIAENSSGVDLTTGWETLLEALISSGFQITATWPVRASQKWRMVSMGTNALASYIVLACRPRLSAAPQTDRRSFVIELKHELPAALRHLQQGNIAPVDFAQAAIGPGMAIYSRYGRILESSGNSMTVRTALSLINQTLTEVLSELEDEFDNDTRWAIPWFEQNGFGEGDFGEAELLSKAKVTTVSSLEHSRIIHSKAGKVRLLRPEELSQSWDPTKQKNVTVWEMTHHLLRVYFYAKAGDVATAEVLQKLGSRGELARDLAYQLFHLSEKKKRPQEALGYNALVLGWPELARLAREGRRTEGSQTELFN